MARQSMTNRSMSDFIARVHAAKEVFVVDPKTFEIKVMTPDAYFRLSAKRAGWVHLTRAAAEQRVAEAQKPRRPSGLSDEQVFCLRKVEAAERGEDLPGAVYEGQWDRLRGRGLIELRLGLGTPSLYGYRLTEAGRAALEMEGSES